MFRNPVSCGNVARTHGCSSRAWGLPAGETVAMLPPSKTRDKVAEAIGIGKGRTYNKATKVWEGE